MLTFYCIAKVAAKTKANVSLQIRVSKIRATFLRDRIECCSKMLDRSSYFTAAVFPIFYIVRFSVKGIFIAFIFSEYVCIIFLFLGC